MRYLNYVGPPLVFPAQVGDYAVDSNETLWKCTATGTPGTWTSGVSPRPVQRVITLNGAGGGTSPTFNTDNCDILQINLTGNVASMTGNQTGNPVVGDRLTISFLDNGTAKTLAWGTKFEWTGNVAQPTTTVANVVLTLHFVYGTGTSATKWHCSGTA